MSGYASTENVCGMQMFPNSAARETNFAARKQKMFLPGVKNIFASRIQILRPKHMFLSLATPGNITRNIVFATMFLSLAIAINYGLARPLIWIQFTPE